MKIVSSYAVAVCLLMMAVPSFSSDLPDRSKCAIAVPYIKDDEFGKALNEWRNLSYNDSHGEWLRVIVECLLILDIVENHADVIDWLKVAGESFPQADVLLAVMYIYGELLWGVERDLEKALDLLENSYLRGNEAASLLLCILLSQLDESEKMRELASRDALLMCELLGSSKRFQSQ